MANNSNVEKIYSLESPVGQLYKRIKTGLNSENLVDIVDQVKSLDDGAIGIGYGGEQKDVEYRAHFRAKKELSAGKSELIRYFGEPIREISFDTKECLIYNLLTGTRTKYSVDDNNNSIEFSQPVVETLTLYLMRH